MKEIEWTEAALADMAALDKGIARRVKQAVERFAAIGASASARMAGPCVFCECGIGERYIGDVAGH